MKALTFLGTGKYEVVTYSWEGKECTTHLFPEAVARIFEPEKVVVFVTREAMATENFLELRRCLGEVMHPVEIPLGRSEQELWEMFDRVVQTVREGEEILLDITHAFRSLPLVVFTAAAYLRRAKRVEIERIVYGAFDARDVSGRVPVFDLTLLLDLLDWLNGVEVFQRHGDATILAGKLDETQRRARKERVSNDLPEKLQKVGKALGDLSDALHLSRPLDVMRHANRLLPLLDEALEEIKRWSLPFAVVMEEVRREVQHLAYPKPENLDAENLRRQLELILYCLRKGLIVQEVTLAREWLVSWTVLGRGEQASWLSREERQTAEKALGAALKRKMGEPVQPPEWYDALPKVAELTSTWSSVSELRNNLAHCAMNENPPSVSTIKTQAQEVPHHLQALLGNAPEGVLYGLQVRIDLRELYGDTAKLEELPTYLERVKSLAGEGKDVVLTGQAPVWLYVAVTHALHGKARRLYYTAPAVGEVLIFDHSAE